MRVLGLELSFPLAAANDELLFRSAGATPLAIADVLASEAVQSPLGAFLEQAKISARKIEPDQALLVTMLYCVGDRSYEVQLASLRLSSSPT